MTAVHHPSRDRLRFLWLAAGLLAVWFSAPAWVIPLAPWLSNVFLLRFFRGQPLWRGLLFQWLGIVSVVLVSQWGFIPAPSQVAVVITMVGALVGLIPFLFDRWCRPYLPTALGTLVFPLVGLAIEYGLTFVITGTIASQAYTQVSIAPLMQITKLAGIWPIVFLLNWTAPVINELWERGTFWPGWRSVQTAWAAVLIAAFGFGGIQLALAPTHTLTVPVAGIALDTLPVFEMAYQADTGKTMTLPPTTDFTDPNFALVSQAFGHFLAEPTAPRYAPVRAALASLNDSLFEQTRRAARDGAKIVAWSEANMFTLKADEPGLLSRAQALSREQGIYLLMAMVTITPGQERFENKVVTIDPQGQIVAVYHKNKLPAGEMSLGGDGTIPVIDTPYGRIAAVICYDMDSPEFLRQLGRQQVDIVFAGSGDWRAIAPWHSYVAIVRGIENGFAVVRPVRGGLMVMADQYGRIIDQRDYFSSSDRVLRGAVPAQHQATLYPLIGDVVVLVAVMSGAALVFASAIAAVRARRIRRLLPQIA